MGRQEPHQFVSSYGLLGPHPVASGVSALPALLIWLEYMAGLIGILTNTHQGSQSCSQYYTSLDTIGVCGAFIFVLGLYVYRYLAGRHSN
jgi:hypothetical protein